MNNLRDLRETIVSRQPTGANENADQNADQNERKAIWLIAK
jgi:hypothetical protein